MIASLSLHWFDLFPLLALGLGIFLARHQNAFDQIVSFIRWLAVLLICSVLYKKPATWIAEEAGMRPDVVALIFYPITVFAVYYVLGLARRKDIDKSLKEDAFGKWEQTVARIAGTLRALTILLLLMSWLHGRHVTEAELHDYEKFCAENFGGIEWPVLSTLQRDVFAEAYTGKLTEKYLKPILVKPLPPLVTKESAIAKGEPVSAKKIAVNRGADGPQGADAIIDELENRGKKRKGLSEGNGDQTVEENSAIDDNLAGFQQTVYHEISLKGISGIGTNKLALINNQSLRQGESDFVKVKNRKVRLYCLEIRESSVLVTLNDESKPIELKLPGAPETGTNAPVLK